MLQICKNVDRLRGYREVGAHNVADLRKMWTDFAVTAKLGARRVADSIKKWTDFAVTAKMEVGWGGVGSRWVGWGGTRQIIACHSAGPWARTETLHEVPTEAKGKVTLLLKLWRRISPYFGTVDFKKKRRAGIAWGRHTFHE